MASIAAGAISAKSSISPAKDSYKAANIKASKVIEIDQIRVLFHLEVSDTENIECCILEILSNTS
ncbi:MAG: hypothetical protein BZY82_08680 [SAR202 cluster bacterium Io17-Chloro-G3]|nr:MAG: hypothetical protein BZY82_08680 [SAR202 cluster bacterium Io17-Chloro-G3]